MFCHPVYGRTVNRPLRGLSINGSFRAMAFTTCLLWAIAGRSQIFTEEDLTGGLGENAASINHFDLLPKTLGWLVHVPSMKTLRSNFKATRFYKLSDEQDVDHLINETLRHIHDRFVGQAYTANMDEDKNLTRLQEKWDIAKRIISSARGKLTIAVGANHPDSLVAIVEVNDADQRFEFDERMEEYRESVRELDMKNYQSYEKTTEITVGALRKKYDVHYLTNKSLNEEEAYTFIGNAFVYTRGTGTMEYILRLQENDEDMFSMSEDESRILGKVEKFENVGAGVTANVMVYADFNRIAEGAQDEEGKQKWEKTRNLLGGVKQLVAGWLFDPASGKTYEKIFIRNPRGNNKAFTAELAGKISSPSPITRFFNTNTTFLFSWTGSGRLWWQILDRLQASSGGKAARIKLLTYGKETTPDPYVEFDELFTGEHAVGIVWGPGKRFEKNFQPVVILEVNPKLKWDETRITNNEVLTGVTNLLAKLISKDLKWEEERYFGASIFSQPKSDFASPESDKGFGSTVIALMRARTSLTAGGDARLAVAGAGKDFSGIIGRNGQHFFPVFALVPRVKGAGTDPSAETHNFLIGGWSKESVKRAVRQKEFPRCLFDTPDFHENVVGLQETTAGTKIVGYADLNRMVDVLFYSLLPHPEFGKKKIIPNIGREFYEKIRDYLPTPKVIADYFGGIGMTATTDPDGNLIINTRSPFGLIPTFVGLRYLFREETTGTTKKDEFELERYRKIYAALCLYATDQNTYPRYLSDLLNPKLEYITVELTAAQKSEWRISTPEERAKQMRRRRLDLFRNPRHPQVEIVNEKNCDDPQKTNIVYVPNHPDPRYRRQIDLYGLGDQVILYQFEPTRRDGLLYFLQRDGQIGVTNQQGVFRRIIGKIDYTQQAQKISKDNSKD